MDIMKKIIRLIASLLSEESTNGKYDRWPAALSITMPAVGFRCLKPALSNPDHAVLTYSRNPCFEKRKLGSVTYESDNRLNKTKKGCLL
jgi:hypothetical protein